MNKKFITTKTLNPLPFQDMEPHRFEDVVRQLVYELRDWAKIEATGRAGSDEGIDIRGREKSRTVKNEAEDGEEGEHLIDGNLWVIQCKRESRMGPSNVKKVVTLFQSDEPVHGYILVAPSNFSKRSYDTFQQEIRKKGINEYHLWGRAELEDMLLMPKNDHLLFAFFGLSLSTRKRTQTSETRFRVNNKNKITKALGDGHSTIHNSVLLRDIEDEAYPYEDEHDNFDVRPRWEEVIAYQVHPNGLFVHIREFYGYVDLDKGLYDYTSSVDLLQRATRYQDRPDQEKHVLRERAEDYWNHLPLKNQVRVEVNGLVRWEEMLFIDDKGDAINEFPHIYLSSRQQKSLVPRSWVTLNFGNEKFKIDGELKRGKICPKDLPKVRKLQKPKVQKVNLDPITLGALLREYRHKARIFDQSGAYKTLKPRDVIEIPDVKDATENKPVYFEVTHRFRTTLAEFLKDHEDPVTKQVIEGQTGPIKDESKNIEVIEFQRVYDWQLNR